MNTLSARNALVYLYKIVEAGERGYAVVASNVSNRALKILYKSYAQQRLQFKEEIFAEIQRLGGHTRPRSKFLGIVHRGRIDIFAALTIGNENVEKVVLKEVLLGEMVAVKAYEKTLKKDLPPETVGPFRAGQVPERCRAFLRSRVLQTQHLSDREQTVRSPSVE